VTKRQANAIAAQLRRAGSLLEMAEGDPTPTVILAAAVLASEATAKIVSDLYAKPEVKAKT